MQLFITEDNNMNAVEEGLIESRVIYLNSVSHLLPNNPAANALRSNYLIRCRNLALQGTVDVPQEIIKASCWRCCVPFKDAPVSYKIEAPKRKNRFQRRLLQNTENINTRFKQNYLNSLQRKNTPNLHNFLVQTCGVCKHKTKKVLRKPIVRSSEEALEISTVQNKPKKKKRKDRFSGLNMNAVLSATPRLKSSAIEETPKKIQTQSTPKNVLNKSQIRQNKVDNKKKLKGLKNIFNDSNKKSPANSLKNFLNSF